MATKSPPDSYLRPTKHPIVSDDVPTDVHAVLAQLLEATEQALRSGEVQTARRTIEAAQTVSRNKLPEGDLQAVDTLGFRGEVAAFRCDVLIAMH